MNNARRLPEPSEEVESLTVERPSMALSRSTHDVKALAPPGVPQFPESSIILKSEPPDYSPDSELDDIFDRWEQELAGMRPSKLPTVRPSGFPTAPPPSVSVIVGIKR